MEKWLIILILALIFIPTYLQAAEWRPRFPARRPYLKITAEEIVQVQNRANTEPWAKEALDRILNAANRALDNPPEIPAGASPDHRQVARTAETVSLAYALSGDVRYLEYPRRILRHYADTYTTFPLVSNGRTRLTASSSLYETGWYIPLVYAYDQIYEALSPEERTHIETGIIRPGLDCFLIKDYATDPRSTDWHYRCYNFQAWHLAAIGLAGFCLQDQTLIDYAIDSPFGYRHQIGHDINDDGFFWERALGYHQFTLSSLLHLTEAAYRCNIDLYTLAVPDTFGPSDPVRELNYPVDGDNGPKTLKMMFDAPFYYPFPNGSCAQIGDSGTQIFRAHAGYRIGYARYKDPKYAYLIQHTGYSPDLTALIHGLPETDAPAPQIGTGTFANTGRTDMGSTLYPSTGLAILRQDERDPEATSVLLNYGPYGGGHGHPDRLNIVLYAHGKQWIPDFGSFSYNGHPMQLKGEWTAQTVSHSTLVADEISQHPQGDKHSSWPSDTIAHPVAGTLQTFFVDALLKTVSATADQVYDGVRLTRTLALFDGLVVDLYRAQSNAAHQYDYVLHIDGKPDAISVSLTPSEGPLGQQCGYQHIKNVERADVDTNWTATWTDPEGRTLRLTLLDAPGTQAIRARSMTNKADAFIATLIARRNAPNTLFAALLEPYRDNPRVAQVRRLSPDVETATGIEIHTTDGARYRLLASDGETRHVFGDLVFQGELALVKDTSAGREIAIVKTRHLEIEGKTYTFDEPESTHIRE